MNIASEFAKAINKQLSGLVLEHREILALLAAGPKEQQELFALADAVRKRYVGDAVHLRGIIEFSNYCCRQCHYCGLRSANKDVKRYRLGEEDILLAVRRAVKVGLKTVVLQSGEDRFYSLEQLVRIVRLIKQSTGMAVTLSLGERSYSDYERLREAGADRYLLKQETSDEGLFVRLRPKTTLAGRVQCLKWLKELGFEIGSGNMVGLPGQSTGTLARDLELMRELDVDMAGIGPFIAHPQTPLAGMPGGTLDMTLKTLAVARLLMPEVNLPSTTALETLYPGGRKLALQCGANVVMPNITPVSCRRHYSIYPNKAGIKDEPEECLDSVKKLIAELGRVVGTDRGDRNKK
ncbi:Radical SAM domain protein [Desulfofarcimen acetoxidans DSM 771]|uniref:Radical SAM domain protein n=1 Tax=Desulfofarcimen acetoxidans (strain ATCC 49208 / DSM 771 / KCTC 5769 / VKM B-1644 / 5575) TaxID=485916 RepID=C8W2Y0_DESAS|nr:[FeFe] hydrogenase H-cluster radical SAM maturase HydE [Desulfofarcimen acetoxidans]ACV61136.1 Radical SAM domain protein [Desulfofarcimen acetoxidans DSM 771]